MRGVSKCILAFELALVCGVSMSSRERRVSVSSRERGVSGATATTLVFLFGRGSSRSCLTSSCEWTPITTTTTTTTLTPLGVCSPASRSWWQAPSAACACTGPGATIEQNSPSGWHAGKSGTKRPTRGIGFSVSQKCLYSSGVSIGPARGAMNPNAHSGSRRCGRLLARTRCSRALGSMGRSWRR
ncbi:hypothetical protein C8J57DRAFT_46622 [Mycena rebaudengoi]|nr:hypothetical protein C8J57DRAFT_46622 [Mycena rebaudengoi]